jgi:hypothetical protein
MWLCWIFPCWASPLEPSKALDADGPTVIAIPVKHQFGPLLRLH